MYAHIVVVLLALGVLRDDKADNEDVFLIYLFRHLVIWTALWIFSTTWNLCILYFML